jgi:HAMP domain-containing protein
VLAILAAFGAQRQVGELTSGWDEYWAEREAEVGGTRLDDALQGLLASGEAAADSLARMAGELALSRERDVTALKRLRVRQGASALALYDRQGQLILWDGEHRGKVPEDVQRGDQRYLYRDLPLFGYLYVTAKASNGSVAMAAYLLRTDLSPDVGADVGDFRSEFLRETGESIRISAESPTISEGVWELTVPDGERLLSVVIERPELTARVSTVMGRWQAVVSMSLLLSWLLLAVGGPPRLAAGTVAAGSLLFLAAFLPLDRIDRLTALFGPGLFELPGPLPVSLGRFGLLALAGFTVIAVLPRPKLEIPFWAAGLISGLLFPLAILLTQGGLRAESLAGGRLEWIVYQGALAAVLTLIVGSALAFTRARPEGNQGLAAAAIVAAIALAAAGATYVALTRTLPIWWTALWFVPTSLAAASLGAWAGWQRPLVGWLMAGVLAVTAALPAAWQQQIRAEVEEGTARLTAIAAPEDLALRRGLLRLGEVADSLDRAGKGDVDVMYGAWRGSGLAEGAVPLRITMWRDAGDSGEGVEAADELRIGVGTDRPGRIADIARDTRERGTSELFHLRWDDARYVIGVPLSEGRVLTAVGPAISTFRSFRSALAAMMWSGSASPDEQVTFIPLLETDPHDSGPIAWARTSTGWQGDLEIEFENRTYHAHYLVELPGWLLASARGSLLLALDLLVFFSFWLGGRALLREVMPEDMRVSGWVISFRARVTLALFGFFVLANALFGTIAYRTLAQASVRSAQAIAERVVEDAAELYLSLAGASGGTRMGRLAQQVGFELLEYRDGELREGSVEELVELGLYEGWMPLEQHRLLDGREGIREYTETSIGHWRYITAYRRLPDGDILGVQVPLQAGATAIQTTDLVELMGFAILVGAALSLVLAWMAGRALTSPLRALQVASEAVGAGDLHLQLPSTRADEFGAVFRAFNRMVSRVRRARR